MKFVNYAVTNPLENFPRTPIVVFRNDRTITTLQGLIDALPEAMCITTKFGTQHFRPAGTQAGKATIPLMFPYRYIGAESGQTGTTLDKLLTDEPLHDPELYALPASSQLVPVPGTTSKLGRVLYTFAPTDVNEFQPLPTLSQNRSGSDGKTASHLVQIGAQDYTDDSLGTMTDFSWSTGFPAGRVALISNNRALAMGTLSGICTGSIASNTWLGEVYDQRFNNASTYGSLQIASNMMFAVVNQSLGLPVLDDTAHPVCAYQMRNGVPHKLTMLDYSPSKYTASGLYSVVPLPEGAYVSRNLNL